MGSVKNLNELEESAAPIKRAVEAGADPGDIALDTEQAFLVYATLCGDAVKTAAAIGCSEKIISSLAMVEGWDSKLEAILKRKKSNRPGDVERAINRAVNFVQANQYRNFLQRVARQMFDWNDGELDSFLTREVPVKAADGSGRLRTFSARALADFASALEKCQAMTYLALSDTSTDRKGREEGDHEELTAAALHSQISKAMTDAKEPATAKGQLLAAQFEMTQAAAKEAVKIRKAPPEPYNSDEH